MNRHTSHSVDNSTTAKVSRTAKASRLPRFDREWKEMIALLPSDRQKAMEEAIRQYQADATPPSGLDGAETMAFMLVKKIVDRRRRQREARLRRKQASMPSQNEPTAPDHAITHHETQATELVNEQPKGDKDEQSVPTATKRPDNQSGSPVKGNHPATTPTVNNNNDVYGQMRKRRKISRALNRKR